MLILRQSFWVRGATLALAAVAVGFTIGPALFGRFQWDIASLLGGAVGAGIGSLMRLTEFRHLSLADRQRAQVALRTGRPTGDPVVDRVARDRLVAAARAGRADAIVLPAFAAVVGAVVVVAAIRVDLRLLFALIPIGAAFVPAVMVMSWEPALVRLGRFDRLSRPDLPAAADAPGERSSMTRPSA